MNAEKKESIIDIRLTQIDANEYWPEAQRSAPILAKIIAAKEEDKQPTRNGITGESPLIETYWAQWDSLKLIHGSLHRH